MQSVTSQDTTAGKACAPRREPHQAVSSLGLRVLAGRASAPQGGPSQLSGYWAETTGSSVPQSGRVVTWWRGLSYLGERVPLARRGHAGESPLMLAYIACEHQRMLESTLCCALSRCL
jgi:hypothetical protein